MPKIAGSNPITVAAELFAAFQQGEINRSFLSGDFDAFLTPEKVQRAAHSLRELGEPKSIKLLSTNERGDMAHSLLEFEFEKTGLVAELYRTRDGKVQEFFIYSK